MTDTKINPVRTTGEKEIKERRRSRRFAWLGPMMERRKTKPESVEEPIVDEGLEEEKE